MRPKWWSVYVNYRIESDHLRRSHSSQATLPSKRTWRRRPNSIFTFLSCSRNRKFKATWEIFTRIYSKALKFKWILIENVWNVEDTAVKLTFNGPATCQVLTTFAQNEWNQEKIQQLDDQSVKIFWCLDSGRWAEEEEQTKRINWPWTSVVHRQRKIHWWS